MTEIKQLNWQRDNFENIEEAWKGDLWDRRRLGEQLTNYVDRLQCGAVLALDARWGEGKTWFIRHWQKHLENENHSVIYLDAFANDYLDDPFLTIAAEISQAFKGSNEIDAEEIEHFNSKTASVLISLAAVIPMIAAKATMHWIGLGGAGEAIQEVYNEGKDIFDVASDEIASKVKEQIEKKIENHHIEKQTIQDFKEELSKLAAKLEKPLVFVIDELDRCRPDFAIRLIERIKHFFDIPKIVFVLVMDKAQFSKVVCHNYGYDENLGEEYLDKFIDFQISLKRGSNFSYYEEVRQVVDGYLKSIGFLKEKKSEGLIGLISAMYLYKKKNFRQLKKILNQISLYQLDTNIKNEFLAYILFDIEHFKVCKIEDVKSELIKIVEYCLEYELIAWESGIPDHISLPSQEEMKSIIFKSHIESELLELFKKYIYEQEKKYFKFPNDIPELRLGFDGIKANFLDEWKQYLNI